jgi:serine phosphatase RsbU (regulator of sigma subunit)
VRDIVKVIPGWAKAAIAALAALLAVAALLVAAAALRNRRLRRQRELLADQVGVLQAALLPEVPSRVGALAVSVSYRPAAGLAAGGDFYDVFALDRGRVGVVVGDVSGHGRDSLGSATFVRHMLRSYLEAGMAPRGALQLAGSVVDDQRRDEFATAIVAIHDPAAGTLSYASAGHPPPIVTGSTTHRPLTVASSPPLGVGSPTGLRQTTLPLPAGSVVCFFTDGLIEARVDGALYGTPRVERVVREAGPEVTADQIVERIAADADRLNDDVAVCVIRADAGAAASTVRVEEIEVTPADVRGPRLRRFLEACGMDDADMKGVVDAVPSGARNKGTMVLRVRLAEDRSGVDVLPVETVNRISDVSSLRARKRA